MTVEEMLKLAQENGSNAGIISLAEYLLKDHADGLSPRVKLFLEKVLAKTYEDASRILQKPSEDIALMANRVMQEVS